MDVRVAEKSEKLVQEQVPQYNMPFQRVQRVLRCTYNDNCHFNSSHGALASKWSDARASTTTVFFISSIDMIGYTDSRTAETVIIGKG